MVRGDVIGLWLASAILLALLGCSSDQEDSLQSVLWAPLSDAERDSLQSQLQQARGMWADAGGHDYIFEFNVREPILDSKKWVRVHVRSDTVQSMEPQADQQEEGVASPSTNRWPTVPQLFSILRSAIDSASSVTVHFHPELGYPESARIDYSAHVTDHEVTYRVRELRLLNEGQP